MHLWRAEAGLVRLDSTTCECTLWITPTAVRPIPLPSSTTPTEGAPVPFDIAKFNSAYVGARFRIEDGEMDVAAEQARLRELLPEDTTAEDLQWAADLIDALADPPAPPREWSALYHEAGAVANAAYQAVGTAE